MPGVYRIEDNLNSGKSGLDHSLAGAVTYDGKKSGRLVPGEYQALFLGDCIVPLKHPLELSTLRHHKLTYLSASLKGILLRIEKQICLGCGCVVDSPQVSFAAVAGCIPGLAIGVALSFILRFLASLPTDLSVCSGLVASFFVAALIPVLGTLFVRIVYAQRQRAIAQSACPACNGPNLKAVAALAGKRLQLRDDKWMQVSIAGKS